MALYGSVLLLCALLAAGFQEPMDTWQDLLVSDVFNRFVHALADKKGLDILIYKSCDLANNTVALSSLLKRVHVPVAIWAREEALHEFFRRETGKVTSKFRRSASSGLSIVCDFHDVERRNAGKGLLFNDTYFGKMAYLLSERLNEPLATEAEVSARKALAETSSFHGILNVTVADGKAYLTDAFQTQCLTCESDKVGPPELFGDRPLNGSSLTFRCPIANCYNAYLQTFARTLQHKNVDVHILPYTVSLSTVVRALVREPLLNGTSICAFSYPNWYRANSVPAGYYDSLLSQPFMKRRQPLPKEIVLVLPFTWQVWSAFLSCVAFCSATTFLLLLFKEGRRPRIIQTVSVFVFAFVNQYGHLSPGISRHHPTRIMLACWSIAVLILSTGFRGALTALLRNIPLEGAAESASLYDVARHDYHVCIAVQVDESKPVESISRLKNDTLLTTKVCWNLRGAVPQNSGKEVHLLANSPSATTGRRRAELNREGFVEVPPVLHVGMVGPTMRVTSPYRRAVTRTVIRSVEAGLYVRAKNLFSFEVNLMFPPLQGFGSGEGDALTLSDLRPYFLLLAAGMVLSVVTLVAEILIFRFKGTRGIRAALKMARVVRRRLKGRTIMIAHRRRQQQNSD